MINIFKLNESLMDKIKLTSSTKRSATKCTREDAFSDNHFTRNTNL